MKKHFFSIAFGLVFSLFVFSVCFFAFSVREGVTLDEGYHISLSLLYAFGWGFTNSPGTFFLGNIEDMPPLAHFVYGNIFRFFEIFGVSPFFLFRGVSALLAIGAFLFSFFTFRLLTRKWTALLAAFFLTGILNFILLSATISYDTFVNFFAAGSFFFFFRFWKKHDFSDFAWLFLFLNLGSLSKISFLPIATLLFPTALFLLFYQKIKFKKNILLCGIGILLALGNIFLYGGNIWKYGGLLPRCEQKLSEEECLQNYTQSYWKELKQDEKNRESQGLSLYRFSLFEYSGQWAKEMSSRMTRIRTVEQYCKKETWNNNFFENEGEFWYQNSIYQKQWIQNILSFLFFIPFFFFPLLFIAKKTQDSQKLTFFQNFQKEHFFTFFVILFYSAILLLSNYSGYESHATAPLQSGIHGRYLFPVLPLIVLLSIHFFSSLFSQKLSFIFSGLLIFVFLQSGIFAFFHNKNAPYFLSEQKFTPKCDIRHPDFCSEDEKDLSEWAPCQSQRMWRYIRETKK